MTENEVNDAAPKPWYKKWWIWALVALGVVIVAAALSPTPEDEEAGAVSTTVVTETTDAGETTTTATETSTTQAPTTTEAPVTTTTVAPTTTTTLPAVIASGEGRGDDVVELDLPVVPVVIELTHNGSSNFAVISLDTDFENIDLLVNTIGVYAGTRGMQIPSDEIVTGLEISADGDWTYEIRPALDEPIRSCGIEETGDDVILLSNFVDTGGAADLTHDGDSNFSIVAWGTDGRDLLVNEIGVYEGTVRVAAGLFLWDISADGTWSIDC